MCWARTTAASKLSDDIFVELRPNDAGSQRRIRATPRQLPKSTCWHTSRTSQRRDVIVRPEVDDSGVFEALAARHPVIEWHMEQTRKADL